MRTFLEPSLELPILFTQFLYFLLRLGLFIAPRLLEHLDFVLSHFQLPLEQVHLRFFLLDVLKFVFQVVHVYLHLMFQLYTHTHQKRLLVTLMCPRMSDSSFWTIRSYMFVLLALNLRARAFIAWTASFIDCMIRLLELTEICPSEVSVR